MKLKLNLFNERLTAYTISILCFLLDKQTINEDILLK